MATVYEPWNLLTQLQRELERKHEMGGGIAEGAAATSEWVPAVDIKEEAERYVLLADLPGINPADINISMENGILTLSGQKETEARAQREGYKRVERHFGSFHRRFSLPDTVDAEGIAARCSNGVLEIVIPKKSLVQPKKIVVVGE
jgi:HSP20 family protein